LQSTFLNTSRGRVGPFLPMDWNKAELSAPGSPIHCSDRRSLSSDGIFPGKENRGNGAKKISGHIAATQIELNL